MRPEERSKERDYSIHEIGKLLERWKHRVTPNNIGFDRRYLAREMCVLIHFQS